MDCPKDPTTTNNDLKNQTINIAYIYIYMNCISIDFHDEGISAAENSYLIYLKILID